MKKLIIIWILLLTVQLQGQSLNNYLLEAEKNSPELKSKQYNYLSAVEKITEEGSLPNTTISGGFFIQEAETRVGAQKAKLSVSQMMPWFGTLEAKKESALFKSKAQLNSVEMTKRKLFLAVKTAYYQLYKLKSSKAILNENLNIIKTFESLALNELENNRATMVDVLKIKMELNTLLNNIHTISENLDTKKIEFNLLLNKNSSAEIQIIDALTPGDSDGLFDKELIDLNPKLVQLENLKSALINAELATRKSGLPTIGLGLDYVFVENRAVENLVDNGKDIVMPMLSISVPLFSKKYSSKQKQFQLEQKAIETSKEETSNQLLTLFEKALSNSKNAKASIKTQIENINQADQAQKVLLAAYQTSKMDFEQILEIQQLKLKFQLKKISEVSAYFIHKSTLEFLTK